MNFKLLQKRRSFFSNLRGLAAFLFFGLISFIKRLIKCIFLLSKLEKYLVLLLLLAAISLSGVKVKRDYTERTKLIPDFGGTYQEVVLGELKYLNPVLASSDTDKSVSTLLYSSLFKFDKDNNIIPDAAASWEVSADNLTYKVTLRNNVLFHDGAPLTAADVVYTVDLIKDQNFKSPLYDSWKDVEVSAESENVVVFELAKPYGPFIYSLDLGILPSHLTPDELVKKNIGSGPFKYVSTKKNSDEVSSLLLESNDNYYAERPYVKKFQFNFFDQKNEAEKYIQANNISALSGMATSKEDMADLSFPTTKRLALIPNLRSEKLKDKATRQIVFGTESFPEKSKFTLSTLDLPLQKDKAEELVREFDSRNIELDVKYYKPTEMQTVLAKRSYELLLYGFDFSHDRDPYVFWHTSQLDKLNFAGYSDKKSDLLLEDARMTNDAVARNTKYDQFFATISSEYLAKFFDPISFNFILDNDVKGADLSKSSDAESRYLTVNKWYLEEKRVKK